MFSCSLQKTGSVVHWNIYQQSRCFRIIQNNHKYIENQLQLWPLHADGKAVIQCGWPWAEVSWENISIQGLCSYDSRVCQHLLPWDGGKTLWSSELGCCWCSPGDTVPQLPFLNGGNWGREGEMSSHRHCHNFSSGFLFIRHSHHFSKKNNLGLILNVFAGCIFIA